MKFSLFFIKLLIIISFDIGLRMLNLHTLGHSFPLAGHIYIYFLFDSSKDIKIIDFILSSQ